MADPVTTSVFVLITSCTVPVYWFEYVPGTEKDNVILSIIKKDKREYYEELAKKLILQNKEVYIQDVSELAEQTCLNKKLIST